MSEPNNTTKVIGQIAIEFSYLELHINSAFSILVNNSDREIGLIIAHNIFSITAKLDLISKLMTHLHETESQSADFKRFLRDMRKVIEDRNDVIHSLWFEERDEIRTAVKSTRSRNVIETQYDLASLTSIVDNILVMNDKIYSYLIPIISQD